MSFDCPPCPDIALPLQQHPHYARAVAQMGGRCAATDIISPQGGVMGTAQWVLRRIGPLRVAWLPRGPIWGPDMPSAFVRRALRGPVAGIPPRSLRLVTFETPGDATGLRLASGHSIAELDLTAKPETLRAAMHGKWRNRLCRAERAGLSVTHRPFDPGSDAPLLALEMSQRRIRRYRALSPGFTLAFARAAPRATRIFELREHGDCAAFMLFLLHGSAATYHVGWTGPAGRSVSAHNLLLWRAMLWLRHTGITRLDLGRVDTLRAPGLARFKLGSGARIRRIGPTCLLI